MFSLTFDTTVNACSIALFKDKTEIGSFQKSMDFGQAEVLLSETQNLLQNYSVPFSEIGLLTVCTGPGSFTGVRSSLAAVRALALACPKLTVCGVSAFEAYAADLTPEERAEINVVLIETKRDDYYVQYTDSNLKKIEEPSTAYYEEIISRLKGLKVTLCGDAVERFLNRPSGLSLHAVKFYQQPPLQRLALCGLNKYAAGKADFPKPLYLKAPDVCIK